MRTIIAIVTLLTSSCGTNPAAVVAQAEQPACVEKKSSDKSSDKTSAAPSAEPTATTTPIVEASATPVAQEDTTTPVVEATSATSTPVVEVEPAPKKAMKLTMESGCNDPKPEQLLKGTSITGCDGNVIVGTLEQSITTTQVVQAAPTVCPTQTPTVCPTQTPTVCPTAEPVVCTTYSQCTSNGATGCLANSNYPAYSPSALEVHTASDLEHHVDCSSSGQTGCIATASLPATDVTNLTAGNIKKNVVIAGITGTYPSLSNPLNGDTSTVDLTDALFLVQVKSSNSFEWFDSAGNRYSRTGYNNITAENIKSGISFLNVTGTAPIPSSVNAWDIRKGVSINGTSGSMVPACKLSTTDDNYRCTASEFVRTGSCSPYACDRFQDKVSGRYWATMSVNQTISYTNLTAFCADLNDIDGPGWRVPSEEEIRNVISRKAVPTMFTLAGTRVWSASGSGSTRTVVDLVFYDGTSVNTSNSSEIVGYCIK